MRFLFLMFLPFWGFEAVSQGEIESEFGAGLTILAGAFDEEELIFDAEPVLAEVSLSGDMSYLLENGIEVSGNLTFRAQTDHPARSGFTGALFNCDPTNPNCPSLNGEGLRGGFSRLATLSAPADATEFRGSLESAYIAIDSPWGEFVIGRDQGVAQRFYEGGPSVFKAARGTNPILDPSGLSISRTRNDISSTAEKVSYVSPRLLGVRAGVSISPDAEARRLDLDTKQTFSGIAEPRLEGVVEAGVQISRLLRESDLRVRGSLTWSNANLTTNDYDDMDTYSAGVDIERRNAFRVGASILTSENGGHGKYQTASVGASYRWKDYEFTLEGDLTEDKTLRLDGWGAGIGARRALNDHVELAVGYKTSEITLPTPQNTETSDISRQGVLLEISIRN